MMTVLYCVTYYRLKPINYLNTILQSAVVTLNIRSRSSKSTHFFFRLQTMYLCKFAGETPTGSEDIAQKVWVTIVAKMTIAIVLTSQEVPLR